MTAFEIRIPILPEPSFYSNVKLAALSLAKLGGAYAEVPLAVSISDHADVARVEAENRWSRDLPVIWRAVPHAVCDIDPRGFSAGLDRFAVPARAEAVILCDADLCLIRDIDPLLARLAAPRPIMAGLMAHFSPFAPNYGENDMRWRHILDAADLQWMQLSRRYSVAPPEQFGHAPPGYFNNGFVAFNRAGFEAIRPLAQRYTDLARQLLDGQQIFFAVQVGLALAAAVAGIDVIELGPDYNCPNSDEMFGHGLKDLADIRALHFLRSEEFDRHTFLTDPAAFQRFRTAAFASPVNDLFRRHVLSLPDVFYSRLAEGPA
jgi:hypothetical protein